MMPRCGGGRRDARVTVVTGNLKVLKKYDATGPAVIDTGDRSEVRFRVEVSMYRSSFVNSKITARGAAAAAFSLLVFLSLASPVTAQTHCIQWVDRVLDTSNSCTNEPFRDRAMAAETFTWKGHEYLMFNGGNELFLYNIDDPANPDLVEESRFNFGTIGDSDYDLLRFDISDESRFVVLAHKSARTVVVDLGTGTVPSFDDWEKYETSDINLGGLVFHKGGSNYLFAAGLEGGCAFGSGLYLVHGADNLEVVELTPGSSCVELGGSPVKVAALQTYTDDLARFFLYANLSGTRMIYRAEGSGSDLALVDGTAAPVEMGKFLNFSIDSKNARAASSDYYGGVIRIWDLTLPQSPALLYEIPAAVRGVSLRSPSEGSSSTLATIVGGVPRSTRTWEVGPANAQEFESTFWSDPLLDHNDGPTCVWANAHALSPDGSTLFLSRFAAHDVFDLTECLEPTPAEANLSVTPSPVFPGQSIEVRDTSSGRIDTWALWITEEPGDILRAGNDVLNDTNDRTIDNFPIPKGLLTSQSYVAHVEVDSSELTPDDPYHEQTVIINRTPTANFTIEPTALIVDDLVTLTATVVEGIVGSGGYEWLITPPSGSPVTKTGPLVMHTVSPAGPWEFRLRVHYDHGESGVTDAGGGVRYGDLDDDSLYEYEITKSLSVGPIAADFFWTPLNPKHTQAITLNGSTSRPAVGLTYEWQVEEKVGGVVAYVCPESGEDQCEIPAETLLPNTWYDITLTVRKDGDTSVKTSDPDLFVGDGNIQPIITWVPANPEIGEDVVFSIVNSDGSQLDVQEASWDMDGGGCFGADSTPDCTSSLWVNCRSQLFNYNSAGTKDVSVSVTIGDDPYSLDPVTVTVQPSGSCDDGGPVSCDYSFNPSFFEIGAKGATGAFSVTTSSGCAWTANASDRSWMTVLAPSGEVTGSGTVRFEVSVNEGPARPGRIYVADSYVTVNQNAPFVPANFTMSDNRPDIGEEVTFFVDPILEVASWDFGEPDCRGNSPVIDCSYLPSSACNLMEWAFPSSGDKSITMVLKDGRQQTKIPTVQKTGQCCLVDGKPSASFEMSADEIFAGDTVYFSDTSSKSVPAKALGFTWTPANPEIGEGVTFDLTGVTGDIDSATWNFGENGCDGMAAVQKCNGIFSACTAMSFTFASSGAKTVSVDIVVDGAAPETVGPEIVTVADTGVCDDGGGGGCSYALTPSSASVPAEGDSRFFNIATTSECGWTASTTSPFITFSSDDGPGSGRVDYTVSANETTSTRSGIIRIDGEGTDKNFRVSQAADTGDNAPTEWWWLITRIEDGEGQPVDEDVYSSTEPSIEFAFNQTGRYRVRLTATNCSGSDFEIEYVDVLEAPVENFVVASAISSGGANGTRWESDFRFFNPCGDFLDVSLVYQPDNVNNSAKQLSSYPFSLGPNETRVFPNVRDVVSEDEVESVNGSILIDSVSESGCKVLSVSKTFNDTPGGTLGLFVPAMPVTSIGVESLNLTGLIRNDTYRSNLRLVNHGDTEAWVKITIFHKSGEALTDGRSVSVQSHSTKQLNDVAGWAGVDGNLSQFTVLAEVKTVGAIIDGFATVIDNISGDSVMNASSYMDEPVIWLPGVVYARGKNDTLWQTDIWFHNPNADDPWLMSQATYVDGGDMNISYLFEPPEWPALEAMGLRKRLGIVGSILGDLGVETTSGYLIFEGLSGDSAPQIAARTFTSDDGGGTYGLHVPSYGSKDLLQTGDSGYIVGVSNSADELVGFRTNLAMLATGRTAEVEVTFFYPDGSQAPEPWVATVWAGQLKQINNVFRKFGLGGETVTGTFKIEVLSGGDLIIYATEIDNASDDSIFIPAQEPYINLAR